MKDIHLVSEYRGRRSRTGSPGTPEAINHCLFGWSEDGISSHHEGGHIPGGAILGTAAE